MERIAELAQRRGCTSAQLALAWVLSRGPDIVPIPGTKKVARLEENAAAAAVVLTPGEQAEIAAALPEAAGLRYPEAMMPDSR